MPEKFLPPPDHPPSPFPRKACLLAATVGAVLLAALAGAAVWELSSWHHGPLAPSIPERMRQTAIVVVIAGAVGATLGVLIVTARHYFKGTPHSKGKA